MSLLRACEGLRRSEFTGSAPCLTARLAGRSWASSLVPGTVMGTQQRSMFAGGCVGSSSSQCPPGAHPHSQPF